MAAGQAAAGDGSEAVIITRRDWEDVLDGLDAALAVIAAAYRADGMPVPERLHPRRAASPDMELPESPKGRSVRRRREAEALGLRVL